MAAMVPYDPFWTPTLRRTFERLLGPTSAGWNGDAMDEGTLPVDILETPDELVVRAAVPGFSRDQIDVQVERGVLSIKAESQREAPERANYYRQELDWSSRSRRIALPGIVDDTAVRAELANGVLTLHIPIAERAKPRHIEIKGK